MDAVTAGGTRLACSERIVSCHERGPQKLVLRLAPMTLPAAARAASPSGHRPRQGCRQAGLAGWPRPKRPGRRRSGSGPTAALPYDRIQVPDAGIQALLDSSIRNIYQAREIQEGAAGLPGRPDLLSQAVGGRRFVPDGGGRLPRLRPTRRRPASSTCSAHSGPTAVSRSSQALLEGNGDRPLGGDAPCPA